MNFNNKNIILFISFFIISVLLTILLLGQNNFSFSRYLYSENYDLISDQLAFKFFINDEWHFPFGKNPNYGIGVGNSIVFSGAVPILSFLIKLIANFLPNNFQFISIWFILCFTLQLFFGYLIIYHYTKNITYSLIASLFFIFSPLLLYRIPIHVSLVAHWIILICLYFEIKNFKNKKRIIFYSFILPLSILIHFYFLIMVLIIKYSFLIQDYIIKRNFKKKIKEIIIPIISLIFVAYISGYFQISAFDAMGFGYGYYSFNLLGLIDSQTFNNSLDWSLFFSDINNTKGQAEGFSYLGLGGILILIFLLINYFINKNKDKYNLLPYFIIFIICFILSISNIIYFGGNVVFEYKLPKIFYALFSITRASGRFIWIIYYLILIFGIVSVYKLFQKRKKYNIIIFLILILQLVDISPALKNYYNAEVFNKKEIGKESKKFWQDINKDFKIIRTTYYKNTSNIFPSISNQILKNNFIKTDVARLGRYDRTKASQNRNKLYYELNNKLLDVNTLYVIDNINHLRYLKYLYQSEDVGFFFNDDVWFMAPGYQSKMSDSDYDNLHKIKPVEIQENIEHKFNSYESNKALGFGWTFSSESEGIWTEGNELNIFFSFKPKIQKPYNLKLKINSSIAKKDKYLTGSIRFNGKKIQNFKFRNSSKEFINILIPELDFDNKYYKIDVIIDNPVSPLDLLQSADGRMLGLLIESIEIL